MDILFKEVLIIDPESPHHNKIRNIYVKNGIIQSIGNDTVESKKIIDKKGLIVTPGFFDMRCSFTDPGLEHKEDIESGCNAAVAGGFSGLALLPNTEPTIQSKSDIEYIKSRSSRYLPEVFPMAAITIDAKGESLTEMIDLHEAGAIAFTDGESSSWHTDILLKSLIYVQKFNGLIINRPEDKMLTRFGDMHEGVTSTMLGLKGMPSLAEEIMIKRDLDILAYTGGKIHFSNISTKNAVLLIKEAKKKGLNVTCDVSVHHLVHTENDLLTFDTNYKSNPPFRGEQDRKALINGIKSGVIDAIVSSHSPQDTENKNMEFDLAAFGLTGLQTLLPALLSLKKSLSLEEAIPALCHNPRKILGLQAVTIQEGSEANLNIIDQEGSWVYDDKTNLSKSRNSPYFGKELIGKSVGLINGKNVHLEACLTEVTK